jgi:AraC family transcriptional regulator of adaptative response/methylated-DNA-[protein]-cysteine methyltransferase
MTHARETITFAFADTPVGRCLIASSPTGIVWLAIVPREDDALAALSRAFPRAEIVAGRPAGLAEAIARVEDASRAGVPGLDLRGTPFQLAVWEALLAIPAGQTRSYADVARAIGRPTAARAVAQACGANRVGVIVPCHRVIGSDGSLTGFAGGTDLKRALLVREGAWPPRVRS